MNTVRLQQARKLFNSPYVPASTNRRNARSWCKAIRQLGPRWLLANPIAPTNLPKVN